MRSGGDRHAVVEHTTARLRRVFDRESDPDLKASIRYAVAGHGGAFDWNATGQSVFPLTSVTKLAVAAVVLDALAEGLLTLGDRVADFRHRFRGEGKRSVTVGDLLNHTSGLPVSVTDDETLRGRQARLDEFLHQADGEPLQSPPGRMSSYSNVGYLLLGSIVESVSGRPLSASVDATTGGAVRLGIAEDPVPVLVDRPSEFDWNSRYWQTLGAPWGGGFGTADALANWWGKAGSWSDAAASSERTWFRGSRRLWPRHSATLGDLLPLNATGHFGASGTLVWRTGDDWLVALTNRPYGRRGRLLHQISNVVAAARLRSGG